MNRDLFPLPLTPFEFYYWCDDRPDYPTTFPVDLTFQGELQRGPLEEAVQIAVERHPLLGAMVDTHGSAIPMWVSAEERVPSIDWAEWPKPIDHASGRFIDLTSSVGLRLWVRASSERSRLVLQFHHACCDALGAMQFIGDLLVAYDAIVRQKDPYEQLRRLEPQRLLDRGDYGLTAANYRPNLRDALATARFWSRNLLRRPALVASSPSRVGDLSSTRADLGYVTSVLDREQSARLRSTAARLGVTVNDLMLRDLLVTLREWNQEQRGPSRRLVVNVPVNLRTRAELRMPAANVLGFWFLQRKPKACVPTVELLHAIRDEMESVRKWRLPLHFIGGLQCASRFPKMLRHVLRRGGSFATAVHSNAGRLLARSPLKTQNRLVLCGGILLENITGVPPIRPGTRVAIGVATYGYHTTLCLHWDPHQLDQVQTQRLLDKYVARLMHSARGGS